MQMQMTPVHHIHKKESGKETKQYTKHEGISTLEEELENLNLVSKYVNKLIGIDGLVIKTLDIVTDVFIWSNSNVLGIYKADSKGSIKDDTEKPLLYAFYKTNGCKCWCSYPTIELALISEVGELKTHDPFIYMTIEDGCFHWCNFSSEIFINNKGNNQKIGNISKSWCYGIELNSPYFKENLIISEKWCSFFTDMCCWKTGYDVEEGKNEVGFCERDISCDDRYYDRFKVGFPINYDENKKLLFLCLTIAQIMMENDNIKCSDIVKTPCNAWKLLGRKSS